MVGVWRHANARVRGMKRVQVEPHLSVTGACSAEWVPIKPKTDAAFLFALIHVLLHEVPRERLDLPFLAHAHGVAVPGRAERLLPARSRRRASRWCGTRQPRRGRAVRHARASTRRSKAATRPTRSRSAPTATCSPTAVLAGATAFTRARRAHARRTRPEWAERDLRRARRRHPPHRATNSSTTPTSAQTIEIEGLTLPYPPGGGDAGQDRQQRLGRLTSAAGRARCWPRWSAALEVPGGTIGTTVRLNRPHDDRLREREARAGRLHGLSAQPDRQGALVAAVRTSATPTGRWCRWPATGRGARRSGRRTSRGCSSTRRPRACRASRCPTSGSSTAPTRRSRSGTRRRSGEQMARFPFVVAFALHAGRDEPLRRHPAARRHRPREPAADPHRRHQVSSSSSGTTRASRCASRPWPRSGEARDFTDIATELARRTGLLEKYVRGDQQAAPAACR